MRIRTVRRFSDSNGFTFFTLGYNLHISETIPGNFEIIYEFGMSLGVKNPNTIPTVINSIGITYEKL